MKNQYTSEIFIIKFLIDNTNLNVSIRFQSKPFVHSSVGRLFLTGMKKKMHTGMILVDHQKAFDALDHRVLLEKIKYFGFPTSIIE